MSIPNPDMFNDILGGNPDGGWQPSATDSARNLMKDSFGRYSMGLDGFLQGDSPDRLEFPSSLGTEKHSHMIVFHIYDGGGAEAFGMSTDEWTDYTSAMSKKTFGEWGGRAVGAGAGLIGSNQLLKRAGAGRLKGWNMLLQGGSAVAGWFLGGWAGDEAAELTFSQDETDALKKYTQKNTEIMEDYFNRSEQMLEQSGRTARFGEAIHKNKDTIALYMPQKIQALSLLDYEQQDMSFMQNLLNDWQGLITSGVIKNAPKFVDSLASFVGMNTNIDTYLLAGARIAPNPRKQLLFREPISRKFEFNFNFSPRNIEESVRAYEIIKRFKKYAYPTLNKTHGQGAFYTFPAEFEIEYQTINEYGDTVQNDWINKIGRCALREINVDYASSGSFSTFENGAPTNMVLSLTFEEMSLLDSNLVEQGY